MPGHAGFRSRFRHHAPTRRAAPEAPVHGRTPVTGSAESARHRDRPQACENLDDENGYRGGVLPGHEIYPYLLRGMTINRANQVWALDTTLHPQAKGFAYLTAVVDWASRNVLATKVAITLEACHAMDVLEQAFKRYGRPESSTPTKAASLPPRRLSRR